MKHLRWLLTSMVFFALPLLLICYGIGSILDGKEQSAFQRAFEQLDQIILAIRKNEAPQKHLGSLLTQLHKIAFNHPNPEPILQQGIRNLQRRFPQVLHFYVIDQKGDLFSRISEKDSPKTLIKNLFTALRDVQNLHDSRFLEKRWKLFQSFIGQDSNFEAVLSNSGEFFDVNSQSSKRRFFYLVSKRGGILAHANQTLDWGLLAVQDRICRFQKLNRFPAISVGLTSVGLGDTQDAVRKAVLEFQATTKNNHLFDGSLIRVTTLESGGFIWAMAPARLFADTSFWRNTTWILTTLLFAILSWFSHTVMLGTREFFFSIRWRLITLFCFASSLPLMVIFIASWDYLQQKYEGEIRNAFENAERSLRGIDARLPQMRFSMEGRMNRYLANLHYETPKQQKHLRAVFRKLFKQGGESSEIALYNSRGEIVEEFSGTRETNDEKRGRKIMGGVVSTIISNLNQEPLADKVDFGTGFMEAFGGNKNPTSFFSKSLGKIIDLSMGKYQSWTMLKPMLGSDGRVSHIFVFHWLKRTLERNYLQQRLLAEERNSPGVKFYARDIAIPWECPEKFRYKKFVSPALQKLQVVQSTILFRAYSGNRTFLVTGIKPKEITMNYLFSVQVDDPIQSHLSLLKKRLGFFALITGLMSVFLGFVLSQKFLTPIGDLTAGVQAVQKEIWDYRVPLRETDEIGQLAGMFNSMIENLQEVSVAREVQSRLFPADQLQVGEYKVFGRSRPATQLGGDYFDYLTIKDRFLFVLIGDVTGHGVPAALLMAMSKAVILHCANEGYEGKKFFESLNLVIFQAAKKKLLMTGSILWVDTQTHQATLFNGGHPFPFRQKVGEKLEMIAAPGFPFGARAKMMVTPVQFEFGPGERILFYTDGLVESIEFEDGRTHFDHLMEYVESRPRLSPDKACDDLLDNHCHILTGKPQPDDFTILIVERQPAQPLIPSICSEHSHG
ncbi:MAG: SpoIIE family protein phosphatase [Candidatus Ozemobacteraceae bacterium]